MALYLYFDDILKYGISNKYLKKALHLNRNKKTLSWQNKKCAFDRRKVLIDIDSIPEVTRTKYNIPTGIEYFEQQQEKEKIQKQLLKEKENELLANSEKASLYNAYNNNWIEYYSTYSERYKKHIKREYLAKLSAKEHAFWLAMIEVTGNKYKCTFGKSEIGFGYYQELKKDLIFSSSIKNIQYFRRKLKELRLELQKNDTIVECIINKKTDKRPAAQTVTEFHKGLVLYFLGHEKKYSYRLCTDLVNHHCVEENKNTISESWIKHIMTTDNEFRTLVYSRRNGTKFLNENILPHASRYPVEFPANLWMIDGTPIQFFCQDPKGRVIRLSLFVVLDAFSRKVVGYDIALNEDKLMVINALKMAVNDEGHLPKEILSDNFSANKTQELLNIKNQLEKMGVNWRLAKVGNPQDKTHVERFFGVFQSEECALYDDYLGEGIKSKRDNRPNDEFLQSKTKKLLTVQQMKNRIVTMIAKYNEREKRNRKSPLELYKLPKPKSVEMDAFKTALMFWNRTKHTIKQGMVKITVNKIEHSYEISSHKLKAQLQNKTVFVRYDLSNLDSVMLFDMNDIAICECKKSIKFHISEDDRNNENNLNLNKHTAKVKSYKNYLEKESTKILDSVLVHTGKERFVGTHPLGLEKNKINLDESKAIIELHLQNFGVNKDVIEPASMPMPVITKNNIDESYESKVVNKKTTIKSSLKVVKSDI